MAEAPAEIPTVEELLELLKETTLVEFTKKKSASTTEALKTFADALVVIERLGQTAAVRELLDALKQAMKLTIERRNDTPEEALMLAETLEIVKRLESKGSL